jgi:hypothetical protein
MGQQASLTVGDLSFGGADAAAAISPISGVIGRTSEILNSSVVEARPFSNVDWMASPMQLSSKVAEKPPCTVPAGLRWMPRGSAVMTTRPELHPVPKTPA